MDYIALCAGRGIWRDVFHASDPIAGPAMALATGMASNLIIIGSIANIIRVEAVARDGVIISFQEFARSGMPVTLLVTVYRRWLWFVAAGGV